VRGLGLAHQVLRYALFRQGMLAMTGAPIRAFVYSREGLEAPDLMLAWIPMLFEPSPRGPKISRQSGLTLYAVLSRNGLEFDGAVSGRMRIRGQAARSIGLAASFWFRVCHPSTLRMVI
jgi:hypothetical protein